MADHEKLIQAARKVCNYGIVFGVETATGRELMAALKNAVPAPDAKPAPSQETVKREIADLLRKHAELWRKTPEDHDGLAPVPCKTVYDVLTGLAEEIAPRFADKPAPSEDAPPGVEWPPPGLETGGLNPPAPSEGLVEAVLLLQKYYNTPTPCASEELILRQRMFDALPDQGEPLHQPQDATSGINAIFGKWPGNETDEEVAEALEEKPPVSDEVLAEAGLKTSEPEVVNDEGRQVWQAEKGERLASVPEYLVNLAMKIRAALKAHGLGGGNLSWDDLSIGSCQAWIAVARDIGPALPPVSDEQLGSFIWLEVGQMLRDASSGETMKDMEVELGRRIHATLAGR